jgi:pimeloyl-ACP methyl ester carboxylesterase
MKRFVKILLVIVITVVVGIIIAGVVKRDRIEIPSGMDGGYVKIGEMKIRVLQKGKGKDILLIHGTPGSIEDWNPIIDELAKRYRVTVYDRPAQGYSGVSPDGYSVEINARCADALIEKLKLVNPVVVGHSYGGVVVMNMAAHNDTRVKAYVVVSSPAYYYNIKPELLNRLVRLPLTGRGIAVMLRPLGASLVEKGMKSAFYPNENAIPAGFIEMKKDIILQPKVIIAQARERARLHDDIAAVLPRYPGIRSKIFLVWGSSDNALTVSSMKKIHEVVPGSKTMIFEGTGHMVQFAHPRELIRIIDRAAH